MDKFTYYKKKRELKKLIKNLSKTLSKEEIQENEKKIIKLSEKFYLLEKEKSIKNPLQFQTQIKRKLKNTEENFHKSTKKYMDRYIVATIKKVAIIICAIGISTVAMQTDAIGTPIKRFVLKIMKDFANLIYQGKEEIKKEIEEEYIPFYLPNNYTQERKIDTEVSIITEYKNKDSILVFSQHFVQNTFVDTNGEYKTIVKNGISYYYLERESGTKFLTWRKDSYQFNLAIFNSNLSLEELFKIIESIEISK